MDGEMSASTESPNIRISAKSKAVLRDLAKTEGTSMQAVLDAAIEHYHRDKFLDEVNAAYARLKADPVAWAEELEERALLDGTLLDGLDEA
jgi:hypothetical protein